MRMIRMRAMLLLAFFNLLALESSGGAAALLSDVRAARGHQHQKERNGWGSWADSAVGRGEDSRHPVQLWVETMMRDLGNHAVRAQRVHDQRVSAAGRLLGESMAQNNATVTEEDEQGDLTPVSFGTPVRIGADDFQRGIDKWMENNPDKIRDAFHAVLWGTIAFLIATGLLIYSEVRTVLLFRELDGYAVAGVADLPREVANRKESQERLRLYLSCGSGIIMVLSLLFVFAQACALATDMLKSIGYAFQGCLTLVIGGAIIVCAQWCLLVVGLCWVCTRPYTGALLIILSLIGELSVEKEEPAAVIVWALFTSAVLYIWLRWGKYLATEVPAADPEKKRLV